MTDKEKLEKVRAEIERRYRECNGATPATEYQELLDFIDSMQKEAKNEAKIKVEQIMAEVDAKFPKFAKECKDAQKPANDDLESFVRDYREKYWYPDDIDKFIGFAKQVANWQKQKDESYTKSMYKVGINTGKELMKQQLMAKAVDGFVKVDAGGYPYIPQMELYDYKKGIPLAKEGDKYKVILIKE